jgi:predicted regulator of Ras-like GTPase activity (Roadblock/LC7/MglB family)
MDAAAAALADLMEISSQIEAAVVVRPDGAVVAAEPETEGERLARAGVALLDAAEEDFGGRRSVRRLEVTLREGSVFALRSNDLRIIARTSAGPASGLVPYDLGTCLQAVGAAEIAPKPRRRTSKKTQATADA